MSQNLQNFVKFQKFQLENLVDFEKCCKTHIFLQKSEPIQPKTSNILPKFCQPTLSDGSAARPPGRRAGRRGGRTRAVARPGRRPGRLPGRRAPPGARSGAASGPRRAPGGRGKGAKLGKLTIFSQNFANFLAGSFSAVSKRNFARKYAFDSIFQALQDLHPFAPLQSQNFRKKSV